MGNISVGNTELVGVLDMVPPTRHPAVFFDDVPIESWNPYQQEHLECGELQLYFGCFFIRSQDKVVLVDTGMGPGPHSDRGNRTGDLLNQLKRHGVEPNEIDIVIHTHLHPDHVGWNMIKTDGVYVPTFPNAEYLVPRLDWEYFTASENAKSAAYVRKYVVPLEKLGRMVLVDAEHSLTEEITTMPTPGHTPGHQVILVSSGGEKAMVVGDVLHNSVQVQESSWCASVDIDKEQSTESRKKILAKAELEGYLVAAGHFHPDRHFGRIIRIKGRRYWQVL